MTQDIWIADIQDECILGLDFLEPQGCMVNLREGTLLIGEEEIALEKSADTQAGKCCRAVLEASVQIPPCFEIVVTAKVRGLGNSTRWGILETQPGGGSLLRDGLLVGRTLVDLSQPTVPVCIMNLTRRKHRVRKGVEIAHCEPVDSVMRPEDPAVAQGTVSEEVPAHLFDLFQRSTDGLPLEQQRSVCQLLSEFSDVFSKGPQDLGHTDLVQHHIHTGDATPIRQAPRRLPLAKREEAEQAIEDMEMSDRMKEYYDCCSEGKRLEVGEPVWLYNPQRKKGVTPKLARPWHGPYVVVTRLNDLVYRIKPGPKGKAKVVHRNRLWKYRGRDPPTWYAPDNFRTWQEDNTTEPQPQDRAPASEVSTAPQRLDAGEEPAPPAWRSGRQRQPPDRYQAS